MRDKKIVNEIHHSWLIPEAKPSNLLLFQTTKEKKTSNAKPVNCALKCHIPDLTLFSFGMINVGVPLWKWHWTQCAPVYTHSAASGWLADGHLFPWMAGSLIGGHCTGAVGSTATGSHQAQSYCSLTQQRERREETTHSTCACSDGS